MVLETSPCVGSSFLRCVIVMPKSAISFDLGQTLVELDESLLVKQVLRRGFVLEHALVMSEQDHAWGVYNASKASGLTGFDAWASFMRDLLTHAEMRNAESQALAMPEEREQCVRYLWSEQPTNNLWRKPIPGMLDLLRALDSRGTKIGVLTNSEGRARELVDELGFGQFVQVVVDSGVEGIEKPDPRIFARMAERLSCSPTDMVHVGDSYEADVLGALGAQMTPVWLVREKTQQPVPPNVHRCQSVAELSTLLHS